MRHEATLTMVGVINILGSFVSGGFGLQGLEPAASLSEAYRGLTNWAESSEISEKNQMSIVVAPYCIYKLCNSACRQLQPVVAPCTVTVSVTAACLDMQLHLRNCSCSCC